MYEQAGNFGSISSVWMLPCCPRYYVYQIGHSLKHHHVSGSWPHLGTRVPQLDDILIPRDRLTVMGNRSCRGLRQTLPTGASIHHMGHISSTRTSFCPPLTHIDPFQNLLPHVHHKCMRVLKPGLEPRCHLVSPRK